MSNKDEILKQINKIIKKLSNLNWEGSCRINEFNVHSFKVCELNGFLQFYQKELENQIAKINREKYWNTGEGAKIKIELENSLYNLDKNFSDVSQKFTDDIINIIKDFFNDNWIYKIYKDHINFYYKDIYDFCASFKTDYSNNIKLNIELSEIRSFNLLNKDSNMISILNDITNFINLVDSEKLSEIFINWRKEFIKYNKEYKRISYKLYNPKI